MSIPYIITENSITIFYENKPYSVLKSHSNYSEILERIKSQNYDGLLELIDIKQSISNYSKGSLEVFENHIEYNGVSLDNAIVDQILKMKSQGFDVEPMLNFLNKLLKNPSSTAVKELFLFIQSGNFVITEDGDFLAYKKVRGDYTDCHSGTFDNSVGQILEMPRNFVDDNRDNTCSSGFHFCSYEYLRHFSGSRVMILKINPEDVVSIPSDYNNTKGRTCKYLVFGEIPQEEVESFTDDSYFSESVYDYDSIW